MLLAQWRGDVDRFPLEDAYPRPEMLMEHVVPVLPLAPVAIPLLENYARMFERQWIGALALMLLGRWVPPHRAAVKYHRLERTRRNVEQTIEYVDDGHGRAAEREFPESLPPDEAAKEEAAAPALPPTGPASAAHPEPEPVLLGGSAPRQARPGDVVLAQFAAYVAAFEPQAQKELEREAAPG